MVNFFRALRNWVRFWSVFDGTFPTPRQVVATTNPNPAPLEPVVRFDVDTEVGSVIADPTAVWEPRQLRKPSASRFTITRVSGGQETVMFDGNDEDKADLVLNRERNRAGFSGSLSVDGEIVDRWGQ